MSMLSCCSTGGHRSPNGSGELGPAGNARILKHLPLNNGEVEHAARRRTCTLMDIGSDTRVTMIPWILFTLSVFFWGLRAQKILQALTVLYGVIVSFNILMYSWPRNWRWIFFSLFCFVMLGLGTYLGIVIRNGAADPEVDTQVVGALQIEYCFLAAIAALILTFFLGWALPKCGCGLVGSSIEYAEKYGWGWNGRVVREMLFGCSRNITGAELVTENIFPRWMAISLLFKERVYWSGEVALDYMFDLANTNTILGCFLSHPVNPYEKTERIMVLLIIAPLIVFPCALCRQFVPVGPLNIYQTIVTAIFATLPRKLLEATLKKVSLVHDKEILGVKLDAEEKEFANYGEEETAGSKRKANTAQTRKMLNLENATRNEIIFFACCFAFVILLGGITCWVIILKGEPLWQTLIWASVGLDFAVILELCFPLIIPHADADGVLHFGFFGQWYYQRKIYTPDTYVKNQGGVFNEGIFESGFFRYGG